MMYFTPGIDRYFANWLVKTTWYTDNLADEERFYLFVKAIDRFSRPINRKANPLGDRNPRTLDPEGLKQNIILAVRQNHPNFDEDYLETVAQDYSERAMKILDFLWATRHGLPQISKDWDPPWR